MKAGYTIEHFNNMLNPKSAIVFNYKGINLVDIHYTSIKDNWDRQYETGIIGQWKIKPKQK